MDREIFNALEDLAKVSDYLEGLYKKSGMVSVKNAMRNVNKVASTLRKESYDETNGKAIAPNWTSWMIEDTDGSIIELETPRM